VEIAAYMTVATAIIRVPEVKDPTSSDDYSDIAVDAFHTFTVLLAAVAANVSFN